MTLLSYQIFHTVSQQGSFARAAELLHLTPSAISHAVSAMEEEFGFALFIRTKAGVFLTSSGQTLLPAVQQVLSSNELLHQTVAQINGLQRGTVKVGAFNSICSNWLPPVLSSFKKEHPAIEIEIYQGSYNDVIEWIRNGTVDLGFLSANCTKEIPITPLFEDRLMCVVPKGFHTESRDHITLEEMRGHSFVIQRTGLDADILDYLKKFHLQVRSNCHVSDDQSTVAMVASGFGICIMPMLVMENTHSNVDVYPILPSGHRTIGLACLNPDRMAPAVQQMHLHIVAAAKAQESNADGAEHS